MKIQHNKTQENTGGKIDMKKYRVNASEYTNLCSMYDKLKCKEIDMTEAPRGSYSDTDFAELEARISEIEELMKVAYGVGALV